MCKIKNTQDRINGQLDNTEESISKDTVIECINIETQKEKRILRKNNNRASVSCEKTSSSPSHRGLESSKQKRDRQKKVLKNQWMEIFQI